MGSMVQMANEQDMELHYLPEQRATEWWRYMMVQPRIEQLMTDDIFVPSVLILMSRAKQLFTVMVWPKGIPQFFPTCDYVYVSREKKRIFGTKEEAGFVTYQSVLATIEPLLDDYEYDGLQIKYLNPEKTSGVAQLVQNLRLDPVDLSEYTQIASDQFHDVATP